VGCVHAFADQLHAVMFWNEFAGRWLRHDDFVLPERSGDMPRTKRIQDFDKYQVRNNTRSEGPTAPRTADTLQEAANALTADSFLQCR